MKKLLLFCLLVAILGAKATSFYPVNVTNNGIVNPNSSVTVSVNKQTIDAENSSWLTVQCQLRNPSTSPVRLQLTSSTEQYFDSVNTGAIALPGEITIAAGIALLFDIDLFDKKNEANLTLENLDSLNNVIIQCVAID